MDTTSLARPRKRLAAAGAAALCIAVAAAAWPREAELAAPRELVTDAGPLRRTQSTACTLANDESELRTLLAASDGPRHVCLSDKVYRGGLEIHRPIILEGTGATVLEGDGEGTVVSIESDDVTIDNLTIRHSGRSQTREDAGVRAKGTRVRITHVAVEDALFGITLGPCPHCAVEHCRVTGLPEADKELRGDGIKLWESHESVVRSNIVDHVRDVVVWYSRGVVLEENTVRHSRYGTHFMYAHDSAVRRSRIEDNVVGIFVMYSSRLHAEHNVLAGAHGPAGMGIGFKESDGVVLNDNWLVANTTGVYLDRTPLSPEKPVVFQRNLFALNEVAMSFLGAEEGLSFEHNDFRENIALADYDAEGQALAARFERNRWSDYAGYDLNHDGVGDVPFELKQLSRELVDATPQLKLFQGTAAFGLIDAVARLAPVFSSRVLLSDPEPSVSTAPPTRPW